MASLLAEAICSSKFAISASKVFVILIFSCAASSICSFVLSICSNALLIVSLAVSIVALFCVISISIEFLKPPNCELLFISIFFPASVEVIEDANVLFDDCKSAFSTARFPTAVCNTVRLAADLSALYAFQAFITSLMFSSVE